MHLISTLLSLSLLSGAIAAPAPVAAPEPSTRAKWYIATAAAVVPTTTTTTSKIMWYVAPITTTTKTTSKTTTTTSLKTTTTTTSPKTTTTTTTTTTTSKPSTTTTTTLKSTTTTVPSTTTTKTTTTLATTSASTAVAAAATTAGISKKKGVGFNTGLLTQNLKVSWVYNWGNTASGYRAGAEYAPMVWSDGVPLSEWTPNAQAAINSGSTHLLAFNEPDLSSQSNMNITQTVAGWKKYMSPFVGKAKLVSPAVTNGGAPMGVAYLSAFAAACPECWAQVDAVALHWYDAAWNTGYFTNYLTDAYNTLKKPIHLTEFAGSGTSAEQQTFLKYVIPWMEQQSFIERYAGFGDFAGNYVNADGTLTALGQVYSDTI